MEGAERYGNYNGNLYKWNPDFRLCVSRHRSNSEFRSDWRIGGVRGDHQYYHALLWNHWGDGMRQPPDIHQDGRNLVANRNRNLRLLHCGQRGSYRNDASVRNKRHGSCIQ